MWLHMWGNHQNSSTYFSSRSSPASSSLVPMHTHTHTHTHGYSPNLGTPDTHTHTHTPLAVLLSEAQWLCWAHHLCVCVCVCVRSALFGSIAVCGVCVLL